VQATTFRSQLAAPRDLIVTTVKADAGQVGNQNIPLSKVPTKAGITEFPWEFTRYRRGRV